ncbi:hypothetical protein MKW94_012026 [Papaver nudicaule]|uniref:Uncharacterized protein n=1 Tax=Papaver nudicaule TaxID=74823 RepID=A0AA41SK40_PAPNU|nr:hypothetical protein [Papaver nudicaule]
MKVGVFLRNCWHLLQGDVRSASRMDMEVAMEESSRVGAECFFIDQDAHVLQKEIIKEYIGRSCRKDYHECDKLLKRMNTTRAFWQEYGSALKEANPEEVSFCCLSVLCDYFQRFSYINNAPNNMKIHTT